MNKNNKINTLTNICCTIGNIPTSYLESMTYEEQLLWLCDFLQNTIIPALNDDIEAITELQNLYQELKDYVDNYFENLDVQEEIDNKIDEMVENGTFQEIIDDFIKLNSVLSFDTLALLKASENLENGSIAYTLGTLTYDDGLGAFYKIRTLTSGDVVDEITIFALTNYDTLIAEKINNKNITDIQDDITDIENDITDIEGNITDIQGDITDIQNDNNYVTQEYQTSKTWIDGKPIYRQVISTTTPSTLNTQSTIGTLNCAISNIVKLDVFVGIVDNTIWIPLPQYVANSIIVNLYLQNCDTVSNIVMNNSSSNYAEKPVIIIAEYTKAS